MARRLLAMGNPAAGGDDEATRRAVLDVLGGGADVVFRALERPDDLDRALAEHPDREPVVLGGDGTLHRVVAALLARGELERRPVGLIPMGTGNDLARTLGIPLDPEEAAHVVLDGTPRPLDLLVEDPPGENGRGENGRGENGRVGDASARGVPGEDAPSGSGPSEDAAGENAPNGSGGIVINAVHVGVGAEASRRATPLKPVLRRAAYAAGALLAGVRSKGWRLRVRVDGELVADGRRRVLMVGVGNGASIGGGTPLAPGARPDDGLADVIVSYAVSPWGRLAYGVLLRLGRHPERDDVATFRGRAVVVEGEPVPANADGELCPPAPRRSWTLRPAAWRVVAPRS
ncbi:diacylglycerol/lipid kinase family protein [Nonomuraea bangladeshensis]|uniref:diacylglycerol/lipid kinase family protein n=1 Tax=Nonomuraea bangladeshensis TaxID=404385 RepID=UPI003C2CF9FC